MPIEPRNPSREPGGVTPGTGVWWLVRKEVVIVYRCQVSFGEALVIQSRSSMNMVQPGQLVLRRGTGTNTGCSKLSEGALLVSSGSGTQGSPHIGHQQPNLAGL